MSIANIGSALALGALGGDLISNPAAVAAGSAPSFVSAAGSQLAAGARDAQLSQLGAVTGIVNALGTIASALGGGESATALPATSFPAITPAVSLPDSGPGANGSSNVVFMNSAPADASA